ncbi:hypothetical protein EVAR_21182_1 [Eumeta japonica]|uniref:Uncharacterized protein n=1 Tax=Eumeta variegata TaxID=151549 RepID=A0A4C1UQ03_EUMVA|nr:hypothetical protein EVAR_21182_1 [Eumeta japonica]
MKKTMARVLSTRACPSPHTLRQPAVGPSPPHVPIVPAALALVSEVAGPVGRPLTARSGGAVMQMARTTRPAGLLADNTTVRRLRSMEKARREEGLDDVQELKNDYD